jgi:hypothetical protein
MQLLKKVDNKIERRKFFETSVKGMFVFMLIRAFPFNLLFGKNKNSAGAKKIKVKINPLAVSRKSIGGKNG